MILPYIDQKPLFDAINFSMPPDDFPGENQTVAQLGLSLLICPSETGTYGRDFGTNYAGNGGFGFAKIVNGGFDNGGCFTFSSDTAVSFADLADGASQTACVSEWLFAGKNPEERSRNRTVFTTRPSGFDNFDEFAVACTNLDVATALLSLQGKGHPWIQGGSYLTTTYNHDLGINGHTCLNGGGGVWNAISTAGSAIPAAQKSCSPMDTYRS